MECFRGALARQETTSGRVNRGSWSPNESLLSWVMNRNEAAPHRPLIKPARHTAWSCPEVLTDADWDLAQKTVEALESFDFEAFERVVQQNLVAYFNRIIGWPEGLCVFALGARSARKFHFLGIVANVLPPLKKAVDSRCGAVALNE